MNSVALTIADQVSLLYHGWKADLDLYIARPNQTLLQCIPGKKISHNYPCSYRITYIKSLDSFLVVYLYWIATTSVYEHLVCITIIYTRTMKFA